MAGNLHHYHLAAGIAISDGRLLMVASRYANHAEPLWNLPGGRQQTGELLSETVVREIFEETGLRVEAGAIAYVSESYDGDTHFLNAVFVVRLVGGVSSFDSAQDGTDSAQDDTGGSALPRDASDHVVAVEWVPIDEVARRIVVAVVREPLVAYLRGELHGRYAGFHDAGVTIEWPPDSR
jgi:ADP-ribose pyrophosphatase YjhB (NUDIX family)